MRAHFSMTGIAFVLTACGTPQPAYQHPAPITDEYAKIVLVNQSARPMWAVLYQDPLTCSGSISITPSNTLKRESPITLYVKKGQPVTVGAQYQTPWSGTGTGLARKECDLMSTFVPKSAGYLISFQVDESAQRCAVAARTADAQASKVPENEFIVRQFHVAFSQPGPWCTDLTQAQRDTLTQLTKN